jgi:hypothetical protein
MLLKNPPVKTVKMTGLRINKEHDNRLEVHATYIFSGQNSGAGKKGTDFSNLYHQIHLYTICSI